MYTRMMKLVGALNMGYSIVPVKNEIITGLNFSQRMKVYSLFQNYIITNIHLYRDPNKIKLLLEFMMSSIREFKLWSLLEVIKSEYRMMPYPYPEKVALVEQTLRLQSATSLGSSYIRDTITSSLLSRELNLFLAKDLATTIIKDESIIDIFLEKELNRMHITMPIRRDSPELQFCIDELGAVFSQYLLPLDYKDIATRVSLIVCETESIVVEFNKFISNRLAAVSSVHYVGHVNSFIEFMIDEIATIFRDMYLTAQDNQLIDTEDKYQRTINFLLNN